MFKVHLHLTDIPARPVRKLSLIIKDADVIEISFPGDVSSSPGNHPLIPDDRHLEDYPTNTMLPYCFLAFYNIYLLPNNHSINLRTAWGWPNYWSNQYPPIMFPYYKTLVLHLMAKPIYSFIFIVHSVQCSFWLNEPTLTLG